MMKAILTVLLSLISFACIWAQDVALDSPPRLLSRVEPSYPEDLLKKRVEGSVRLLFVVTNEGKVVGAHVVGSTDERFESSALEAIRQFRFSPAIMAGKKVSVRANQTIQFSLEDDLGDSVEGEWIEMTKERRKSLSKERRKLRIFDMQGVRVPRDRGTVAATRTSSGCCCTARRAPARRA